MHTGTLKKWALALTFWLALHSSSLRAQVFTNDLPLQAVTTGSNPVDFEFRSNGVLIGKGDFGVGSLVSDDQGDGTRLLWFPALGAFRAGRISEGLSLGDDSWDSANIGDYSAALGYNTTADGEYSMAFGNGAHASGTGAAAMGGYSTASGYYSIVSGLLTLASGFNSIAMGGYSTASGNGAIALGNNNTASASNAVALGFQTTASGNYSTALGSLTTASGYYSTATGNSTTASGIFSSTSGYQTIASGICAAAAGGFTTASAYASFVVGVFNAGGGSSTSWVATDPLFEVGNGSGSGHGNPDVTGGSDAFKVLKNGNAVLLGTLKIAPGGDIPMFTGE